MARRTSPTAEEVAEATASEPTKVSDAEILKAIQNEFANRPKPPDPKRTTITDLYHQMVAVVCSSLGYHTVKLRNEQSAVKLMELTLMWALNNRGSQPSHEIIPDEETGMEGAESEEAPFEPDEVIEASSDQTGEE